MISLGQAGNVKSYMSGNPNHDSNYINSNNNNKYNLK